MQTPDDIASTWCEGALVFIEDMVRPAAFVYFTSKGVTWVEPSYADPYGSPCGALHTRLGKITPAPGDGFDVVASDGRRVTVLPVTDGGDLVHGALDWFVVYLRRSGKTFQAERKAVRRLIKAELQS